MGLDMTFNGRIGGSTGLLDWGSDIARMWGLGMQNGLNLANAMRDQQRRSALEPGEIEARFMQNEAAKEQLQNIYANQFAQNEALNLQQSRLSGLYDPTGQNRYQTPVNTNANQVNQHIANAPRNTTATVVGNGIGGSGHTNSSPRPTTVTFGINSQYGTEGN